MKNVFILYVSPVYSEATARYLPFQSDNNIPNSIKGKGVRWTKS